MPVELETLYPPRNGCLDEIEMVQRAVVIFFALDHQDWTGDSRQVFLEIPVAEIVAQPYVRPSSEKGLRIVVVLGETVR